MHWTGIKLFNFQLEVTNTLEARVYQIIDEERVLVIKNWLGQEGLLLMETFKLEEKEKCKTTKGLLSVLGNRFKQCLNCILIPL